MSATGINHVSVHAADPDVSEAFYRELTRRPRRTHEEKNKPPLCVLVLFVTSC
jgi:catechol 2,3-dioxygenase-like lactoylglutathione lyase family enzyme